MHAGACACVSVCVRGQVHAVLAVGVLCVWASETECVRTHVWVGGDFTFLRSVVYQTNLLRALAG